jgi:hypothetical protein
MSKTIYATRTVSEGIFSSEFHINIKDSSFLVDRVNVQVSRLPHNGDEVEGRVIAYVVAEKGDQTLIEMPGADSPRAWASKSDLVFA